MSASSSNNARIAKNTLFLYLRSLFVMGVSIFTSRIILDALGVEDYGIYNVVGGFVAMFSVLSGTLTAASQRYIAYELGKKEANVRNIFSTTVTIHCILAVVILILLETVGLWFVNSKMNIAPDRIAAANWVFQCSVITFCVNLISIPYNSAIIAYERMSAFAYIGIFEALAKLGCVYALFLIKYDSLIIYSIFMLLVAIVLRLIYSLYCHHCFPECRFKLSFDKPTYKGMLSFCGWNFIGSTAGVLNNQGINLLVNVFFGVTFNAARGIAQQVDNAINTFVQNFLLALAPQITRSYAAQNYQYVNTLVIRGTKFAFLLFFIIGYPIAINADYVLSVWLKEVPEYAAIFVQYAIIYTLCQTLSHCLYTTMLATGNIKKYQLIVGGLSILAFPVCYIFFKIGLPSEWGYISMIIFSIICLVARLWLMREMVPEFSVRRYVKEVLCKLFVSIAPVMLISLAVHKLFDVQDFPSFIWESLFCVLICAVSFYFLAMSKAEKEFIKNYINKRIRSH